MPSSLPDGLGGQIWHNVAMKLTRIGSSGNKPLSAAAIVVNVNETPQALRRISKEMRALVLFRDGSTCQICGAIASEPHPSDPTLRTQLHVCVINNALTGGDDHQANLHTLCSVCKGGPINHPWERPRLKNLIREIGSASSAEQIELLRWLARRFPQYTARLAAGG